MKFQLVNVDLRLREWPTINASIIFSFTTLFSVL